MDVRGREHIPNTAALVAGKHQSLWETFAILPLLDDPCMVLKKELTYIPLFGWFALKFRHDRGGTLGWFRSTAQSREARQGGDRSWAADRHHA